MTDTLTPLTSAELADLKATAKAAIEILARGGKYQHDIGAQTILRLIAMIERQDGQIEKLRGAMVHFRKMGFEKARETLAVTELVNDKR